MSFNQHLTADECQFFFQKMFGGIWHQEALKRIVFSGEYGDNAAYETFMKKSTGYLKKTKRNCISCPGTLAIAGGKY